MTSIHSDAVIHTIETWQDFEDLKKYVIDNKYLFATVDIKSGLWSVSFDPSEKFELHLSKFSFTEKNSIHAWLKPLRESAPAITPPVSQDALIYGKDTTKNIVSIEAKDGALELFIEENGVIRSETRTNKSWLLCNRQLDQGFSKLAGDLHYKYIKQYKSKSDFFQDKNKYRMADTYCVYNDKEAAMIMTGITYYKGMKVSDVSRFHFDLETIGLLQSKDHRILCISTTYVHQSGIKKRLFALDEYECQGDMIEAFCAYLRECNPSIVSGFNIFGFDFPYLQICAVNEGVELSLGRDDSELKFDKKDSKFRRDGSQDYDYKRCYTYGREIVDLMFVAYHFDFAHKYESYSLKNIIKQEGLIKDCRVFYDASKIRDNWNIPEERKKIKEYCIDDSDDSESLFKLMIPAYFYLSQYVPKSFQAINYSASGSQLNAFLVRSYLQIGHSVSKADEVEKFEGAISFGVPGIYKNVKKIDLAALYPNIIRSFKIYSKIKDPKAHLLVMTDYFTEFRLKNKKLYKETNDRYYYEMEQGVKIFINSLYGLMGATGLNYNFPHGAARVTQIGREILKFTIKWATNKDYDYWVKLFREKTGKDNEDTNSK